MRCRECGVLLTPANQRTYKRRSGSIGIRQECKPCAAAYHRKRYREKTGKTLVNRQFMVDFYGEQMGEHRWKKFQEQEKRIRREMSA